MTRQNLPPHGSFAHPGKAACDAALRRISKYINALREKRGVARRSHS
jgi:hypothetical protein